MAKGFVLIVGSTILVAATVASCRKTTKASGDGGDSSTTTISSNGGGTTGTGTSTGTTSTVPQVGAISLTGLGTASASSLALDSDTCNQSLANSGVMGLALGGACETSPIAAKVLLGGTTNGDFDGTGVLTCNDWTAAKAAGKDPGILLNLLCEPVMVNNPDVASLAFTNGTSGVLAISFSSFGNTTAVGTWSHGDAASFPADVRIWTGASFSSLQGAVALNLTSLDAGTVDIDIPAKGTTADVQAQITYANTATTTSCATSPSKTNCDYQDIQVYAGTGTVSGGLPNGFHLAIYADDKNDPKFLAIEGRYSYSDGSAGADFPSAGGICPASVIPNIRSVYFTVVQKGGQVWGQFDFRDANDAPIDCTLAGVDPFAQMAAPAGICENLGSSAWVPCTDVLYTDYTSLWTGESAFANVTQSPVGAVWASGAPTQEGICLNGGCRDFNSGDL